MGVIEEDTQHSLYRVLLLVSLVDIMEPIIAEARKYNFTPNCVQLILSISRKSSFDNFIDGYTDVNVYFK